MADPAESLRAVVDRCRSNFREFLAEYTARGLSLDEAAGIFRDAARKAVAGLDATDPWLAELYIELDLAIIGEAVEHHRADEEITFR